MLQGFSFRVAVSACEIRCAERRPERQLRKVTLLSLGKISSTWALGESLEVLQCCTAELVEMVNVEMGRGVGSMLLW